MNWKKVSTTKNDGLIRSTGKLPNKKLQTLKSEKYLDSINVSKEMLEQKKIKSNKMIRENFIRLQNEIMTLDENTLNKNVN